MKNVILVLKIFVLTSVIIAIPCYGKSLAPKVKEKITPMKMVKAAYELATLTPETPTVVIVEKVIINERVTIRPVQIAKK